jgi:S1-C subfamily serine protease
MTAVAVARRPDARAEWQSFLAVLATAIIAVAAGIALLGATDYPSRQVERDGVTADIPAGWILTEPVGDLLFSAYDPMEPDRRYTVAAVPAVGGTPEDAARSRLTERRPLLPGFEILENGPAAIGDVATHRLRYTFAAGLAGSSELVEVREDYVADGERVLIVGLEAPREGFAGDEATFDRFARQVVAGRGAAAAAPPVAANLGRGVRVASAAGSAGPSVAAPAAAEDLVAATVQIFILGVAGDLSTVTGYGSGTIISADGLILTNAHVAKPSAGGLGVEHGDPTPRPDPAGLVVAIVDDEAQPAVPRYLASVIAADGYLDAALIRIDRTIDGAPVAPGSLTLPFLPIGDSDALSVGDDLTIVGFPGIGLDTISLSAGKLSGFLGDPRIGDRAWLKTDAVISQGNSGGLAANAAGELIGLPTWGLSGDVGGYSFIRPMALVRPMVDDAIAGRPSLDSRYSVPSTGTEAFTFNTWSEPVTDCAAPVPASTFPSGTRGVTAVFDFTGVVDGEDLLVRWSINGEPAISGIFVFPPGTAGTSGCYYDTITHDRGLPEGTYTVELFVGATLRPVASATTAVGSASVPSGAEGASTVSGRVIDVDSGQPISGALVFVLKPGTDAAAWARSPDSAALVSYGQSGGDGRFQLPGLTGGLSYPVIVVADGYHAVSGGIGPVPEGQSDLESDVKLLKAGP